MNWIERLYEINNKDLYSQGGEGLILEYIAHSINPGQSHYIVDIGGGDGFNLSNSMHLYNLGWQRFIFDIENGKRIDAENVVDWLRPTFGVAAYPFLSIDIDGNDYWILDKILSVFKYTAVVAEFNAMYTDSRTIAYNPDHEWAGDSYYGFTFEAGKKLAEKHGYKVIFQLADMNMFMVRADLIEGLTFPEVTYKQNDFFKLSTRTDWATI